MNPLGIGLILAASFVGEPTRWDFEDATVGKLHAGGFPCLRRQPLPDGEDQYVYVRQGAERT